MIKFLLCSMLLNMFIAVFSFLNGQDTFTEANLKRALDNRPPTELDGIYLFDWNCDFKTTDGYRRIIANRKGLEGKQKRAFLKNGDYWSYYEYNIDLKLFVLDSLVKISQSRNGNIFHLLESQFHLQIA